MTNPIAGTIRAVAAPQSVFRVDDMTCGHCVGTVRAALHQSMPEAVVTIDLSNHRVSVTGDGSKAQAAIAGAGYTPELVK